MCIPCYIAYYVKAFSQIFIFIGAPHFHGYIPPLYYAFPLSSPGYETTPNLLLEMTRSCGSGKCRDCWLTKSGRSTYRISGPHQHE